MTLMERLRGIPVPDETMDRGERAPWRRQVDTLSVAPDQGAETTAAPVVGNISTFLVKLEKELNRSRLDEIASAIRALTYGEMMELAAGFWKARGEAEITSGTLAAVIHRWSGSRT